MIGDPASFCMFVSSYLTVTTSTSCVTVVVLRLNFMATIYYFIGNMIENDDQPFSRFCHVLTTCSDENHMVFPSFPHRFPIFSPSPTQAKLGSPWLARFRELFHQANVPTMWDNKTIRTYCDILLSQSFWGGYQVKRINRALLLGHLNHLNFNCCSVSEAERLPQTEDFKVSEQGPRRSKGQVGQVVPNRTDVLPNYNHSVGLSVATVWNRDEHLQDDHQTIRKYPK